MKRKNRLFRVTAVFTLAAALILAGCGSQRAAEDGGTKIQSDSISLEDSGRAARNVGAVTLSVNPEIRIEYDEDGQVRALVGSNDDGEEIVSAYQDFTGKDCQTVLKDLIVEIYEKGYFVEDVDGHKKNIVIQIEPGSILPEDDFLESIYRKTQEAIEELELTSGIVTIDRDDYDPDYTTENQPSHYITLEKAQEIALTQANVSAEDAVFDDREFDFDNGVAVYELEFVANGIEYDYDVDAVTGKVLKAEHKEIRTNGNLDGVPGRDDTANGDNSGNSGNDSGNSGNNGNNPGTGGNSGGTGGNTAGNGAGNGGNTAGNSAGNGGNTAGNGIGVTDYDDTDYGPNNDGVTDYNDTDYGPNNDGVTDYNDTDYGPNNDGVTDYDDTDYGPHNDGVTDYDDTDYGPHNDGVTDYDDTDYVLYDDGAADDYDGDSYYDEGNSDYDD